MFNVKLIRAEGLRRVLVALFYIGYVFSMVYCIVHARENENISAYYILLAIVPFGVWCEVLRCLYLKANDALNLSCDPKRCLRLLSVVQKTDILHQYQVLAPYLRGFAQLDMNHAAAVEGSVLTQAGTAMTAKRRLDFEFNFLMFSAAVALHDFPKTQQYFETLQRIFSVAKRTTADIISLQKLISGIFLLRSTRISEAAAVLNTVNPEALKPRMRAYFCFYLSELYLASGQRGAAEEAYRKAVSLAPAILLIAEHGPV